MLYEKNILKLQLKELKLSDKNDKKKTNPNSLKIQPNITTMFFTIYSNSSLKLSP